MTRPGYLGRPGTGQSLTTSWINSPDSHTGMRFFVWDGVSGSDRPTSSFPTSGGFVDGVVNSFDSGVLAHRGSFAKVEAGGSVTSGDDLETDGAGRAVTASGGTVVARALEGASSGNVFWIAFTGA